MNCVALPPGGTSRPPVLDVVVDPESDPLVTHVPGPAGRVRVWVWPALAADADSPGPGARRVRRRRDETGRPVLVAFHGWTDSGEVFGPLAEGLGRRWTVLAPDAPGHGGTAWQGPEYRMDDQVAGGLAVLDVLPSVTGRRAPVVVLGHSMGAIAATGVAAARPRVVRQVVLEDPVGARVRAPRRQTARRRWVEGLQALDADSLDVLARAENHDWPEDELGPWARSKTEVDVAHLQAPTDWGEPVLARLSDLRCPVTLVHGLPSRDSIVSPRAAQRMAAVCRARCEVVTLDAGHCPRREARTPFVATLAAVLGRYDP